MTAARQRHFFFATNAIIVGAIGGIIGVLVQNSLVWGFCGVLFGGLLAWFMDWAIARFWPDSWLYRRRVVMLVLIELPLLVFVVAPWAYVVSETFPKPSTICCVTPADFGADYETVTFAGNGVTLAGWYIPPTAADGAAIIVIHGSGGTRMSGMWHAAQLHEAGYGLLLYDRRALGESEGDARSWGWLDIADVSGAVDFLAAQPEVDPERIGVVGLSLGGKIALPAAAADSRIQAVITDGLGPQLAHEIQPRNLSEGFPSLMLTISERMMAWYLGVPLPEPITDHMDDIAPRPVLIIAGEQKHFEVLTGQQCLAVAGPNAELWVIPGGTHLSGPQQIPDIYAARMVAFFDAALRE